KKKRKSGLRRLRESASLTPALSPRRGSQGVKSRNPRALSRGEEAGEARAAPACRIDARKLARPERLHKPEPLPLAPQSPRDPRRVVLVAPQPRPRLR